jgi:hypothetical protein
MIQELVAFSESQKRSDDDTDDGEASNKIPNVKTRKTLGKNPKKIAKAMRDRDNSK